MPRLRPLTVALFTLSIVSTFFVSFAGAQRSAIDTYAITNARIVTVSGPTIERGTLVIRNGLIVAVGANVNAPPDARIIDGNGLTVYPGLIDSYTNLALPEAAPSPSPGGGGGGGAFLLAQARPSPGGPNSTQPPGLQPEVMVEDVIRPGGTEIESSRSIGITTALTSPRSGIWMGQSALINLAGDTPQQMIVRSPVAMHVGFTPLRGVYPGSLMGVFATLRQMMLDAQRYRDALATYERSPRGMRRPEMDRSLAALVPVVDGRMPVVMLANSEREIARALDLAAEFKLKLIVAGGREADRLTDRLAKQNVPVLLSLNLPRRTTAAVPEADPEPLRVLRDRVEAQQTAGKLARAGVRFAFQSGSLTNISDLLANANRTIENGLSPTDAVRAFTIWPATIFGVENQIGSIETGKIANVVVTRGELFDRNRSVAHVFIDGRPVDLRPPTGGPGGRNLLSGTWNLAINLGQGEKSATLNLQQEGERVTGSISGTFGTGEISNASTTPGGEVRFTVPVEIEGQTREATFTGTLSGDQIRGTVTAVGMSPGTFTGSRARPN
ncbi:MAG: amidohydrolase family protein [Acidobacteria bacterium]|nr:amidohydrolase family protein [Acidobacteriota bacterium]MCA1627473.1 amidohydrolase family protein [Acidobacteriota bacterium]